MTNVSNNIRIYNEREQHILLQKKILLILTTIVIITICCITGGLLTNAHGNNIEDPIYFTYYTDYEVSSGESLWSIASDIDMHGMTTKQIIKEIKTINQLDNNIIYADDIIIIPYTSTEFK